MPVKRPEILQFHRLYVTIGKAHVDSARQGRARRNIPRRAGGAAEAVPRNREALHAVVVAPRV
jgi:hypothetical protein